MRTWSIVIPQGDWVDTYPTTNGRIIQGIRLAFLFVLFVLALIVAILLVAFYGPADKLEKVPWAVIERLLQLLGWLIFGLIGVAAAQFVGKRATTNPEAVKAISNAKIAEAAVITAPPPPPERMPQPEAVTALQSAAAVEEGDPHQPIGEKVPGAGD